MNKQQKIAFLIGILSLVLLDICFVRSWQGQGYIFMFALSKWFRCDYWYHLGLIGVFITFILLMNGNKGYENINKSLEEIKYELHNRRV